MTARRKITAATLALLLAGCRLSTEPSRGEIAQPRARTAALTQVYESSAEHDSLRLGFILPDDFGAFGEPGGWTAGLEYFTDRDDDTGGAYRGGPDFATGVLGVPLGTLGRLNRFTWSEAGQVSVRANGRRLLFKTSLADLGSPAEPIGWEVAVFHLEADGTARVILYQQGETGRPPVTVLGDPDDTDRRSLPDR